MSNIKDMLLAYKVGKESGGGGKPAVIEAIEITDNGTYTAPEGVDGYSPITVNVPQEAPDMPEEAFTLTGDCDYRFASNGWNWFITTYGSRITTDAITSTNNMFYYANRLYSVPFEINIHANGSGNVSMTQMFAYSALRRFPKINLHGRKIGESKEMFAGNKNLYDFTDMALTFDKTETTAYRSGMFKDNTYMATVDPNFFNRLSRLTGSTVNVRTLYNSMFSGCKALGSIRNVPVSTQTYTSSAFGSFVSQCGRTNSLVFETDNGLPYAANWKSQTIDATYLGFDSNLQLTGAADGRFANKRIITADDYEALKNDENSWTTNREYARYNHDSAVETINSLPDTSAYLTTAGGTNTIKFTGNSGSLTDGGAINTLTEAEIAVAAAKGWTITLA